MPASAKRGRTRPGLEQVLLLTNVSSIKNNSLMRKAPCSMQRFEFSMAGVPGSKETAQGRGLRMQSMNFRGHQNHVSISLAYH
jgi:hypothetical protein